MAFFYARQYDKAIAAFRRLQDLPPYSLTSSDRFGLARAYAARGQFDNAIAEINIASQQAGGVGVWMAELARVYALAGQRDKAQQILVSLAAPQHAGLSPANLGFIHAALGDDDRAFAELDRAVKDRSAVLLWANVDPRLDPLRGDPRFKTLVSAIGLPQQ